MTADKVGELEALLARATPGPWVAYDDTDTPNKRCEVVAMGKTICHIYHSVAAEDPNNAALIAAAVNALPELLRIYRAWQGAAVGECSAAGRMELDGDSVCGFFISTSADELRRNPFGQRVRLLPDGGQGA